MSSGIVRGGDWGASQLPSQPRPRFRVERFTPLAIASLSAILGVWSTTGYLEPVVRTPDNRVVSIRDGEPGVQENVFGVGKSVVAGFAFVGFICSILASAYVQSQEVHETQEQERVYQLEAKLIEDGEREKELDRQIQEQDRLLEAEMLLKEKAALREVKIQTSVEVAEALAKRDSVYRYGRAIGMDESQIGSYWQTMQEAEFLRKQQDEEYEQAMRELALKQQATPTVVPASTEVQNGSAGTSGAIASPEASPSIASDIRCQALDEIVTSRRSTVIASVTGTGKSVSESYILNRFNQLFPENETYVISQKNDSFCGLREKGKVCIFDPLTPEESFGFLETVFEIYNDRRLSKEADRHLFDKRPVRLILSDWHSIHATIKDMDFYKKKLKPKISTLITVGRELNCCLMVDTQSYNLDSLGLAEDSNIRLNLNILCQGYTFYDEWGNLQGDYGMIGNLLNNRFLVPDGVDQLKQRYEELKVVSQQNKTPVLFTSVGRPRLDVLPDLRAFKPGLIQSPPASTPVSVEVAAA